VIERARDARADAVMLDERTVKATREQALNFRFATTATPRRRGDDGRATTA
jgi:hypothetical protein